MDTIDKWKSSGKSSGCLGKITVGVTPQESGSASCIETATVEAKKCPPSEVSLYELANQKLRERIMAGDIDAIDYVLKNHKVSVTYTC